MSESEIQILREEIRRIYKDNKESNKEIKDTLNTLGSALTDIRVLVAEDYIKRDEFEENRKEMLKEMEKLEQEHKNNIAKLEKEHKSDIKDIRKERYQITSITGAIVGVVTSIIFGVANTFK